MKINRKPDETRLFWTVDSDSANEEIFETLDDAIMFAEGLATQAHVGVRIRICIVRNSYYDEHLDGWNYDDYIDTFETVSDVTSAVLIKDKNLLGNTNYFN